MSYCSSLSLTRNSIYSIHSSYYSPSLSATITSFFIIIWLFLSDCLSGSYWVIIVFLALLILWINDFGIENSFGFTITEQFSLIYGIKLLILSELMLFFSCFWGLINFRFISNAFSFFFCFPLLSSYSFAIPYSNVIILLFSSLAIQSAQIFYKVGLFIGCIEQLAQTISSGIVFLVLQIKEFLYSYLSISDCMIGSIFYFTTGLHGAHVFFGCLYFYIILLSMFPRYLFLLLSFSILPFSSFLSLYYFLSFLDFLSIPSSLMVKKSKVVINASLYFIEFSFSFFFSSYYWHFVDWIWFFVFLVFFLSLSYLKSIKISFLLKTFFLFYIIISLY